MKMLTDEALLRLIKRLDPIAIAVHTGNVAHISLIGYPGDIYALDTYLMQKRELKKELDPDLSSQ